MIWLSQNLRSICEAKSWIIVIHTQMTMWAVGLLVSRWGLGSWFPRHTSGPSSWCSQPVSSPLPTHRPRPGLVYVTLGSSTLCNFKVRSQETLLPHLSHSLACSPHTSNPHSGGKQLAGPMEPWRQPRWWGPEAFVQKPENSYQQWCELEISTPALWSFQTTSTALNSLSVSTGEKKAQPKSWELCFIWQTSWWCQPGTALSDHSEGALQRGKGEARVYRSFTTNTR